MDLVGTKIRSRRTALGLVAAVIVSLAVGVVAEQASALSPLRPELTSQTRVLSEYVTDGEYNYFTEFNAKMITLVPPAGTPVTVKVIRNRGNRVVKSFRLKEGAPGTYSGKMARRCSLIQRGRSRERFHYTATIQLGPTSDSAYIARGNFTIARNSCY